MATIKKLKDNNVSFFPLTTLDAVRDENGKSIEDYLAEKGATAMTISSLSNPSSITLDASAARTYTLCNITSATSITLSGGAANAGIEHYILFHNSGSEECAVTPSSEMIAPEAIKVPAGKYVELSYIYTGSQVIITCSAEIG